MSSSKVLFQSPENQDRKETAESKIVIFCLDIQCHLTRLKPLDWPPREQTLCLEDRNTGSNQQVIKGFCIYLVLSGWITYPPHHFKYLLLACGI